MRTAIAVLLALGMSACAMTRAEREYGLYLTAGTTAVAVGGIVGTVSEADASGTEVWKPGIAVLASGAVFGLVMFMAILHTRPTDAPVTVRRPPPPPLANPDLDEPPQSSPHRGSR